MDPLVMAMKATIDSLFEEIARLEESNANLAQSETAFDQLVNDLEEEQERLTDENHRLRERLEKLEKPKDLHFGSLGYQLNAALSSR